MYLTDKKNNITHETNEHEDLEVLLESFSKQVEEIVNEAQNIEVRICLGVSWELSPHGNILMAT
jgi:magnesium transporter